MKTYANSDSFAEDSYGIVPVDAAQQSVFVTDWRNWCRLCAKDDPLSNVNVYSKKDHQNVYDASLATAIGKYFWINIKIKDELSSSICVECYTLINSLVSLTDRINKVQAMFNVLNNTKMEQNIDTEAIRSQYGLMQSDFEHIIKPTKIEQSNSEHDDLDLDMYEQLEVDEEADELLSDYHALDDNENAQLDEEVVLEEMAPNEFNVVVLNHEVEQQEKSNNTKQLTTRSLNNTNTTKTILLNQKICKAEATAETDSDADLILSSQKRRRGRPRKTLTLTTKRFKMEPQNKEENSEDGSLAETTKYKCKLCDKCYKKPLAYKKHMQEIHDIVPDDVPDLVCEKCSYCFSTEKQLNIHNRRHLSTEEKLHNACPFCDKKFTTVAAMRRHVEGTHEGLKPYICDTCGKGLKTLNALNEHKLVHTDDCPYECTVCKRRFKNKARLKIHSDIHEETNYVCNVCGLNLNTRRTLKMHMLVHTDEKQFKCDFCDAAFKRGKALKNHLILHTGLRPYLCNFCGKSFSNGSNCRSHKKKSHPQEVAAEDAEGKTVRIEMPPIDVLRANTKETVQPRKVRSHTGGLPERMRALLIAAEKREKALAEELHYEESTEIDNDCAAVVECETELEGNGDDDDDDEEVDEEIIYEIIDEM